MPFLTTSVTINIGTWDIRTTWETEMTSQIEREMLLYTGHEERNSPHTQEAVLMLSEEARKAFIGCNQID